MLNHHETDCVDHIIIAKLMNLIHCMLLSCYKKIKCFRAMDTTVAKIMYPVYRLTKQVKCMI